MSTEHEVARRVLWLTAGLVGVMTLVSWVVGGPHEAAGALAGGLLTMANFLWLSWTAGWTLRGFATGSTSRVRRALWLGATGARFAVIAVAFGVVIAQGWIGLVGLLVALTALPATVVAEGLRGARLT